jgi:hypothetical protein
MTYVPATASLAEHARSAAYDIVLLGHVLSALAGYGVLVVAGAYALALGRPGPTSEPVRRYYRPGPTSEPVRRYYRPGVNWAGRVLALVPVLGAVLVAMSKGDWSFSDEWIIIGLLLWAVSAAVAEMGLWPTERRLQAALAAGVQPDDLRGLCLRTAAMAGGLFVVLVVATVVMVAKP